MESAGGNANYLSQLHRRNDHVPPAACESKKAPATHNLSMVNNDHISELFLAATEAMEEAIINALRQAGWPGVGQDNLS